MFAYTIRRLIAAIPVLLAASFLVFWLSLFTGDPVMNKYGARNPPVPQQTIDLEYQRLGLNHPFFERYWNWLTNLVVHQDFGESIDVTRNLNHELGDRLIVTLRLVLCAMLLALVLAIITGVLSAVRQYSKTDYTFTLLGFVFVSMPTFWIAVVLKHGALVVNEATGERIFFTLGDKSYDVDYTGFAAVWDIVGHMILPTISLALITYATWSRYQRSAMLEVLNSDYMRLARAKGLMPRRVLVRHGLRTALIPMTTVSAITIASILGGAVITETVFVWQGMGDFLLDAIRFKDTNQLLAWLMAAGVLVVIGNIVADLLYAVLDPRIRYE